MSTPSLIELQDKVLDFLLRYREGKDPALKFVLRRSNADRALDEGNWFPGKGIISINFWSGPRFLVFRMSDNGFSRLYENISLEGIDGKQKTALDKIIKWDNTQEKYKTKTFSSPEENALSGLRAFLENEKRTIDEAVQNKPVVSDEEESGDVRGLGMLDETEFQSMLHTVLEFREKRKRESLFPSLSPSKPQSNEVPIALESLAIQNFQGPIGAKSER